MDRPEFSTGAVPSREAAAAARVSADEADLSREAFSRWTWNPSRALIATLRDYDQVRGSLRPDRILRRWLAIVRHRFWSVVCGVDIPIGSHIARGFLLPHPNGVVIHPDARIGVNCLLFQQVTLGTGGPVPGAPVLEGHVDVGAGAKVLGGVRVGRDAVIGANAVVLCDVPAGATAVGVPARVIEAAQGVASTVAEATGR